MLRVYPKEDNNSQDGRLVEYHALWCVMTVSW